MLSEVGFSKFSGEDYKGCYLLFHESKDHLARRLWCQITAQVPGPQTATPESPHVGGDIGQRVRLGKNGSWGT